MNCRYRLPVCDKSTANGWGVFFLEALLFAIAVSRFILGGGLKFRLSISCCPATGTGPKCVVAHLLTTRPNNHDSKFICTPLCWISCAGAIQRIASKARATSIKYTNIWLNGSQNCILTIKVTSTNASFHFAHGWNCSLLRTYLLAFCLSKVYHCFTLIIDSLNRMLHAQRTYTRFRVSPCSRTSSVLWIKVYWFSLHAFVCL